MAISPRTRKVLLFVGVVASVVASFAPTESKPVRNVVGPPLRAKQVPMTQVEVPVIEIRRLTEATLAADPLSSSDWRPPPPPPPKPQPAPPPMAPPFPYTYLGKVDDKGTISILIGKGEATHAVRKGDVLDAVWRIESIGSDTTEVVFVPLNQKQTLATGDTL